MHKRASDIAFYNKLLAGHYLGKATVSHDPVTDTICLSARDGETKWHTEATDGLDLGGWIAECLDELRDRLAQAPGGAVSTFWASYEKEVLLPEHSAALRCELRRAFYAGAMATFADITGPVASGTKEQARAGLDAYRDEYVAIIAILEKGR